MNTFRLLRRLTLPLAALALHAAEAGAQTTAAAPLTLQVYNAGAESFHANAVLVAGKTDAVLLDAGFTRADALRIAAMVLDSGKTLKAIVITQADPDFYFGLGVLTQVFPQARVVTAAATRKKIEATLPTKLQVWGPRLGANAPQAVPLPEALATPVVELEGERLELRGLNDGLPGRSYVWLPSLRAIAGGVGVFAGLHVWTADTPDAAARAAWQRQLAAMAALQPLRLVPGHSRPGAAQDLGALRWTRDYLARFETELPKAADAAALIATMQRAYPDAGLGIALDIGAKVTKGEMAW